MILSIMLVGSFLKTVLMVVCYRRGSPSSKVLAMDMRNDVATSLVAIVCATVGTIYWPYADPVGGIIVWWGIFCSSHFDFFIHQLVGLVQRLACTSLLNY
ncbi:unnamed protein product [Heligmosomoides polygyrus]|uniref:7TM_GPCR_Srx domain-containing protein n=1 Tax=Heligmosomoides polygyrus TaxID=6339 RepID=A0A183F8X7_HELPZ|nr:unnamed protein product [Heligmosomoides polygyrus]